MERGHAQSATLRVKLHMAIVPYNDGLYQFEHKGFDHMNVTTDKMFISEAYHRPRHISHTVIKHVIVSGHLTGIDLDQNSVSPVQKLSQFISCSQRSQTPEPLSMVNVYTVIYGDQHQ